MFALGSFPPPLSLQNFQNQEKNIPVWFWMNPPPPLYLHNHNLFNIYFKYNIISLNLTYVLSDCRDFPEDALRGFGVFVHCSAVKASDPQPR